MELELYQSQILKSLIVLIVFVILRWILTGLVRKFAKKIERVERRTGLIVKYIGFSAMFMIILGLILIWGVQIKDLGLVMSSVFAVIGVGFFAQWSILSNITSGIIMFFVFPYKIGDYIKIHDKEFGYEGVIEDIKAFHIIIRTSDNHIVTYPNSMTLQKGVTVVKPDHIEDFIHEEAELNKLGNEQTKDRTSNII